MDVLSGGGAGVIHGGGSCKGGESQAGKEGNPNTAQSSRGARQLRTSIRVSWLHRSRHLLLFTGAGVVDPSGITYLVIVVVDNVFVCDPSGVSKFLVTQVT